MTLNPLDPMAHHHCSFERLRHLRALCDIPFDASTLIQQDIHHGMRDLFDLIELLAEDSRQMHAKYDAHDRHRQMVLENREKLLMIVKGRARVR